MAVQDVPVELTDWIPPAELMACLAEAYLLVQLELDAIEEEGFQDGFARAADVGPPMDFAEQASDMADVVLQAAGDRRHDIGCGVGPEGFARCRVPCVCWCHR